MPGDVQGLGRNETLGKLILDGKQFDARLDGSIVSSSLERTIDAASTLTLAVDDPERFLQSGRYYERRADLLYDDLWFRMVAVQKQGDIFTLTFEDREVAILRRQTKPRRMSRAHHTRAQFLQALIAEVPHIGFICPELTAKQPIAPFSKSDQQTLQQNRRRGIPLTAKFTIQGVQADRTQIRNLNLALNVAESLGAGHLATMAMLYAGIGESGWRDIMQGNRVPVQTFLQSPNGPWGPTSGYGGVLQGQVVHHSDNWFGKMNGPERTIGEATSFLQGGRGFQGGGAMKIAKATPSEDPGKIADTVEGAPYSGHYGHHAEAQKIIDLYGGIDNVASSDNGSGRAYVKQYEFSRGAPAGPKGEDTWACGQRLASEVQWRWFIVAGVVYFISDIDLIQSAPRMTINEDTIGVENIDYDLDVSPRKPNTVTVTCRATRWAAPPGTVVTLDETMGPVAGAWIVSDILRNDLTDEQTTVTLTTVEFPKKEPASQVLLRSSAPSKDGGVLTGPDTSRNPGTYVNPFAKATGLVPGRVDMGQDFSMAPGSPILAIGKAHVEGIYPNWYRGQPIMVFKFLDGSHKGRFWFLAEQITPAVAAGDTINAGTIVAHYAATGTGIEIGWASGNGQQTLAQATTGYTEGQHTTAGQSFAAFLAGLMSDNSYRPGGGART